MIKIRTISYNLPTIVADYDFDRIEECASEWRKQRYYVRTQRLTLPAQTKLPEKKSIQNIASFCNNSDIRWFNIPLDPWMMNKLQEEDIAEILAQYDSAFCNLVCAKDSKIREDILMLAGRAILRVSEINDNGSANFRFGASMNVKPDGPFFPFTYSSGNGLSFSVGLELAEEINILLGSSEFMDYNSIRSAIISLIEPQIEEVERVAVQISQKTGVEYRGIDFSLAPLPQNGSSVIAIVNKLGVTDLDDMGALFATAFITNILKGFAKRHKNVGFSGVMYSLLEDAKYAEINDLKNVSLDKMVALSTMCGCGIDMVPIPFTTNANELKVLLMEVACVSSRLHKPLGVRVLPVKAPVKGRTNINEDKDFIKNTALVKVSINSLLGISNYYDFNCEI